MDTNPSRVQYLDGLRGVACLMVVAFHYSLSFSPSEPIKPFDDGVMAVAIFFVISGYVLTDSFATPARISVLLGSRLLRLAIPSLAATGAAWFVYGLVHNIAHEAAYFSGSQLFIDFTKAPRISLVRNLLSIFIGFSDTSPLRLQWMFNQNLSSNVPVWTISYEILGSCVVLMLVRLRLISRPVWICGCLTLLALMGIREIGLFIIGHMLRTEAAQIRNMHAGRQYIIGFASCALIGACFFVDPFAPRLRLDALTGGIFPHQNALNGSHSILGITCFLAALLLPPIQRALSTRVAQYLGKLSFSVYLVHWPIMLGFGSSLYLLLGVRSSAAAWLVFAAGLAITIPAAAAFERCVDAPTINFCRRIKRGLLPLTERKTPAAAHFHQIELTGQREPSRTRSASRF